MAEQIQSCRLDRLAKILMLIEDHQKDPTISPPDIVDDLCEISEKLDGILEVLMPDEDDEEEDIWEEVDDEEEDESDETSDTCKYCGMYNCSGECVSDEEKE